jgi:hypothetical protein
MENNMNRQQAIAKARYYRIGAAVIDCETGQERLYEGQLIGSRIDGTRTYKDFYGNVTTGPRYRRTGEKGPSIAAAKRATRGMAGVVVERAGENLRAVARARVVAAEMARKAAEEAAATKAAEQAAAA